jgi:hypothetical protein
MLLHSLVTLAHQASVLIHVLWTQQYVLGQAHACCRLYVASPISWDLANAFTWQKLSGNSCINLQAAVINGTTEVQHRCHATFQATARHALWFACDCPKRDKLYHASEAQTRTASNIRISSLFSSLLILLDLFGSPSVSDSFLPSAQGF